MDKDHIEKSLFHIFLKEFQAVWLIKLEDLSIEIYTSDYNKIIPDSVKKASIIKNYEEARHWYIDNYVVEHSRNRLLIQTDMEYILTMLGQGESFYVDYGRINGEVVNYNQLYYDKISEADNDTPEYVIMGFRSIDITKKAELDELTGLLTRKVFFARAEELLMENPDVQYDLEISDIVDFKKINETYGVSEADKILKWIANYLLKHMDDNFLIGRYGSDQFVVMAPHKLVQNVLEEAAFSEFINTMNDANIPKCDVKFGIYENVPHDKSIISSCDKALIALNSIKGRYGKFKARYNETIGNNIDKQRRIEGTMRKALEENQFKVYYQPKHDAKTGKIVGAEALIRWIHPEYGFMSPADFIPLFEQNGFIEQIDSFVWRKTCENLRIWKNKGIQTVPVSVNASRLSLIKDNLVEDMVESTKLYELPASDLHIEVTETLMTENTDYLVDILNKLREVGFSIELDDFGSGYSSLNVLSTFPIDILKLDMSFLQQFGDIKRSVVLESCIGMAQRLGFKTVSEGVELEEQKEFLDELGVDTIQGYYYSKPLPEDEFEKYLLESAIC